MGEKLASMRKSKTEQVEIDGVTVVTVKTGDSTPKNIGSPTNPIIPSVGDIYILQTNAPNQEHDIFLYFKPTNINSLVMITKNWDVNRSSYGNRAYLIETDTSGSYISPFRIDRMSERVSGELNETYTFSSSDKSKPFFVLSRGGYWGAYTMEILFR